MKICSVTLCFLTSLVASILYPDFARSPGSLSAPSYYLAVSAYDCRSTTIDFRGATNLPGGAVVLASVNDFDGDGWKRYSEWAYVSVGHDGFFKGQIRAHKGFEFRHNLLLTVSFYPNAGNQPASVLSAVGTHGEYLAGVENPSSNLTELSGLSRNPQLYQSSGWFYGLETMTRVPTCGTEP